MSLKTKRLSGRIQPSSGAGSAAGFVPMCLHMGSETPNMSMGPSASLRPILAIVLPIPVTVRLTNIFWKFWFVNSIPKRSFWLKTMPNIIKVLRCGLGSMLIEKKWSLGFSLLIHLNSIPWNPYGGIQDEREPTTISFQLLMRSLVQSKPYFVPYNTIHIWWRIILCLLINCQILCRFI